MTKIWVCKVHKEKESKMKKQQNAGKTEFSYPHAKDKEKKRKRLIHRLIHIIHSNPHDRVGNVLSKIGTDVLCRYHKSKYFRTKYIKNVDFTIFKLCKKKNNNE